MVFASNSVHWWEGGETPKPEESGRVEAWQVGSGAGTLCGERGWQLVLARGEGSLCIFVSLLCRRCSNRHMLLESQSHQKKEVESLHLLMAAQQGGYFWNYGVFPAVL